MLSQSRTRWKQPLTLNSKPLERKTDIRIERVLFKSTSRQTTVMQKLTAELRARRTQHRNLPHPQQQTRQQRPARYPPQIKLKIGSFSHPDPDAGRMKIQFIPQFDDFVEC